MRWFSDVMGWVPWLLGGGGLAAGLAIRFLGLAPVLGALGKALEVLLEVLKPILVAVAEGAVWLWQNVFWKGLKDILDDWVTIVTVCSLAFMGWTYMEGKATLQQHELNRANSRLEAQVKTLNKELKQLRGVAGKLVPKPQPTDKGFKFFWE